MATLLLTKLRRPSLPSGVVARPHLLRRLDEGLKSGRRLVLVSAPAGFGKSACFAAWAETLGLPISWLSLDPADDEPGRFFTYLVAALQRVDARLGQDLEGVFQAGQLPPGEVIATTLVNDLVAVSEAFMLVLDDFHVIQDQFVLDVLATLVANLPPQVCLVLLTREDPPLPLARLRANNQLTEIRASDLRFSSQEADTFLNQVMGLSVSPADLALLQDKTEGWVAGLQLAGQSLRDRGDPSAFIASLSGSHRHILRYLTEEVLNRQPEEIKRFLLQTSILDSLTGELCDAVSGRADGRQLLENLARANLFLIPLDDEQRWYRFYHLFADLLRELQRARGKAETAELHRRASDWYAEAGMPGEAVEHAMAVPDYASAVRLIEKHVPEMIMQWRARTVSAWMQALPAEWSARSPRANLAFARMHLMHGSFEQAAPYLERLHVIFSSGEPDPDDPSLRAEWLALQASLLGAQGKPAESVSLANEALRIAPATDAYVLSLIYMGLASAHQQMEDHAGSLATYRRIVECGRSTGSLTTELLGISGLGLVSLQRGQLHYAFDVASRGVDLVERSGSPPPIAAAVYGELGQVHYQWYQIEQAEHYFRRASQVSAISGFSDAEVYYGVVRSRLAQLQGDLDTAARELQKAVDLTQETAPAAVREELTDQQVRVFLAQHRPAAAEMALIEQGFSVEGRFGVPALQPGKHLPYQQRVSYNSALRVLLHRAEDEPAALRKGVALADSLLAGALHSQYLPLALEALLLRAQFHAVLGNEEAGLADHAQALELAEPEGFVSIFVEQGPATAAALSRLRERKRLGKVDPSYLENVLRAVAGSQAPGGERVPGPPAAKARSGALVGAGLVESLTEREAEVLRLMAEGLKYQEMADRLFISLNTVRFYVKAIYGKLGVDNRVKAIALARERGLI